MAESLTYCINLSLLSWVVQVRIAKTARVTPIFKSGDKNDLCNYHPISILPTLSKLLERVVYNRLRNYIDKLNIIVSFQYGFRKKNYQEHNITIYSYSFCHYNNDMNV